MTETPTRCTRQLPPLAIRCGQDDRTHTVHPDEGTITIGRVAPADIVISDARISSQHARIDATADGWVLTDTGSTNGTYVDGVRIHATPIDHGLTAYLGNAQGIPMVVTPLGGDPSGTDGAVDDTDTGDDEDADAGEEEDIPVDGVDERYLRAGQAVAERRRQLGLSQRDLLARGVARSQGTLVNFENGRSWPRKSSRARLEEVLQWPPGTIAAIGAGQTAPRDVVGGSEDDRTEVLSKTIEMQLVVDAAEIGLNGINARILTLPPLADPAFGTQVVELARELRTLEAMIRRAVLTATNGAAVVAMLSEVRRAHTELMGRLAMAPDAPLGARLYTARQRSELQIDEIAAAAGVSADTVEAAENNRSIDEAAVAALHAVLDTLSRHF